MASGSIQYFRSIGDRAAGYAAFGRVVADEH